MHSVLFSFGPVPAEQAEHDVCSVFTTEGGLHPIHEIPYEEYEGPKHFAQEDDLMLLALEADLLGPDLKWEPSRGGALFPHLYRALYLDDIVWSKPLPKVNGTHQFPEDMS